MNRKYAEILFALYINGGQSTVGWLMEFLFSGKDSDSEEAKANQQHIGKLVSSGLVEIYLADDNVSVALTNEGTQVALVAAGILSEQMLEDWLPTHAVMANS